MRGEGRRDCQGSRLHVDSHPFRPRNDRFEPSRSGCQRIELDRLPTFDPNRAFFGRGSVKPQTQPPGRIARPVRQAVGLNANDLEGVDQVDRRVERPSFALRQFGVDPHIQAAGNKLNLDILAQGSPRRQRSRRHLRRRHRRKPRRRRAPNDCAGTRPKLARNLPRRSLYRWRTLPGDPTNRSDDESRSLPRIARHRSARSRETAARGLKARRRTGRRGPSEVAKFRSSNRRRRPMEARNARSKRPCRARFRPIPSLPPSERPPPDSSPAESSSFPSDRGKSAEHEHDRRRVRHPRGSSR